jgi:hypothetical protein
MKAQLTCGEFNTECEAANFFDQKINQSFFIIEPEVKGRRLFDDKPTKDANGQNLRIDRILHPTKRAILSGWRFGPIGVEIKKSNVAIGPVFAQVFEQRQSIFLSKHLGYTRISPAIFAIFPVEKLSHDLHSLSETQSILQCHWHGYHNAIRIGTSGKNILWIYSDRIEVMPEWQPTTKKGHRGPVK